MKQALSAIIIAGLGVLTLVQAQQTYPVGKCSLTLAQSPEIRNLRLGMTSDEALRIFPGSSYDATIRQALSAAKDDFGVARFSITRDQYLPKPKFENVAGVWFQFLDNRLSHLSINYEGLEWKTVDHFISKLSESLNLPTAESWETEAGGKRITCQGFGLLVGSGHRSSWIQLKSLEADKIVANRQEAAKEKARREFKP